ncbi:hypothetical protein GCM10027160_03990 [Streptomyces calidiresistens]|uniref:Histidine kinase/HSP90-like ATPase domain-containing protein n=1 Tax=Streptomyces calidiresistens TaxID=1485586 RepID=A0A7W3XYN8_9ACTN|nr:hypothetical protein [Streptomyces calidiresistens]
MATVVTQHVPASASVSVPHGPSGPGLARRSMRRDLRTAGVPEAVVDDAVLVLTELLSNACRHARPLEGERVRATWHHDRAGEVTVSVTDGGGPTRPRTASPSVSARGGRGLTIIGSLTRDWGVLEGDPSGAVTVWAVLPARAR